MKIPLKWLQEYIGITLTPADLANRLTMAGTEVKGMQDIGGSWANIVVGQITAINPHPNADRLSLATVDLGTEQQTVVTGAPNLKVGDKVAFAYVRAQLIDGHSGRLFRLKSAKIRGVVSNGMVCSEKELDLGEEVSFKSAESEMARQLIEQLSVKRFEPEKFEDEFRARVLEAVEEKIAGHEITTTPEAPKAKVIDLFEALKASVEESEAKKRKLKPPKKAAAKKGAAKKPRKKKAASGKNE